MNGPRWQIVSPMRLALLDKGDEMKLVAVIMTLIRSDLPTECGCACFWTAKPAASHSFDIPMICRPWHAAAPRGWRPVS